MNAPMGATTQNATGIMMRRVRVGTAIARSHSGTCFFRKFSILDMTHTDRITGKMELV